jgi:hypothetical protein
MIIYNRFNARRHNTVKLIILVYVGMRVLCVWFVIAIIKFQFTTTGTTASVVQWSEFLATDPEAQVRFPALPEKKSSGSETGSTQPREYN